MLHAAAHHVVCVRTEREAGQLTEGPIHLRGEVAQKHTFCHLNTIPGPGDIDEGGVEVTDVTVEGVLLSWLGLLPGIHQHCWSF